jgi:hypothetical protein
VTQATGGNSTYFFKEGNTYYKVHVFTSSGTLTITQAGDADILLVAGGGGGGAHVPGGGGAGGLIYRPNKPLTTGAKSVVIGSGGLGSYNAGDYPGMPNATAGGNSTFEDLTAIGGASETHGTKIAAVMMAAAVAALTATEDLLA